MLDSGAPNLLEHLTPPPIASVLAGYESLDALRVFDACTLEAQPCLSVAGSQWQLTLNNLTNIRHTGYANFIAAEYSHVTGAPNLPGPATL
jgi:hypothetical protein